MRLINNMKFAHSFQTLSESTHSQLKKNVYQNYRQFIDTAKEIGFLEKEMYQLSHMITDQRNLLLELTQFNVSGDSLDANDLVASIEEDDIKEKKEKEKDKTSKQGDLLKGTVIWTVTQCLI